jgi:hypothetical protein
MVRNFIRQGDLLFIPRAEIPGYLQPKLFKDGIIAQGEATGHHHRPAVLEDAEVFEVGHDATKYLKVGPNGVSITHEEHQPVNLEPNTIYEVHRAREFDYLDRISHPVCD